MLLQHIPIVRPLKGVDRGVHPHTAAGDWQGEVVVVTVERVLEVAVPDIVGVSAALQIVHITRQDYAAVCQQRFISTDDSNVVSMTHQQLAATRTADWGVDEPILQLHPLVNQQFPCLFHWLHVPKRKTSWIHGQCLVCKCVVWSKMTAAVALWWHP